MQKTLRKGSFQAIPPPIRASRLARHRNRLNVVKNSSSGDGPSLPLHTEPDEEYIRTWMILNTTLAINWKKWDGTGWDPREQTKHLFWLCRRGEYYKAMKEKAGMQLATSTGSSIALDTFLLRYYSAQVSLYNRTVGFMTCWANFTIILSLLRSACQLNQGVCGIERLFKVVGNCVRADIDLRISIVELEVTPAGPIFRDITAEEYTSSISMMRRGYLAKRFEHAISLKEARYSMKATARTRSWEGQQKMREPEYRKMLQNRSLWMKEQPLSLGVYRQAEELPQFWVAQTIISVGKVLSKRLIVIRRDLQGILVRLVNTRRTFWRGFYAVIQRLLLRLEWRDKQLSWLIYDAYELSLFRASRTPASAMQREISSSRDYYCRFMFNTGDNRNGFCANPPLLTTSNGGKTGRTQWTGAKGKATSEKVPVDESYTSTSTLAITQPRIRERKARAKKSSPEAQAGKERKKSPHRGSDHDHPVSNDILKVLQAAGY